MGLFPVKQAPKRSKKTDKLKERRMRRRGVEKVKRMTGKGPARMDAKRRTSSPRST
jgi:hypothetical protein